MSLAVHLFVFESLSDWEPGYAIAGINNPHFQRKPGRYRVRTASVGGRTVVTAGGVRIQPDGALESVEPAGSAMLILPGGAAWDEGHNGAAVEAARTFLSYGVPVAAICGAMTGGTPATLVNIWPRHGTAVLRCTKTRRPSPTGTSSRLLRWRRSTSRCISSGSSTYTRERSWRRGTGCSKPASLSTSPRSCGPALAAPNQAMHLTGGA
jgi:putative intracellular protease/amidase